MAPNFIQRMRAQGLPPEPPEENPNRIASASWEQLREYATRALSIAQETDDVNKMLTADNESLRRENERLAEANAALARENRLVTAFAQNLRTRMSGVREAIETAERESLQFANHQIREHAAEPTAEETAEVRQVMDGITRINGPVTLPPNKMAS